MTRFDVCCAVAEVTGESLSTIDAFGFDLVPGSIEDSETDQSHLWLDCPFCGREVHLSDQGIERLPESAECGRCETVFDYQFDEIYEADPTVIAGQLLDRQMAFAAA
jgi:hypothetical protein